MALRKYCRKCTSNCLNQRYFTTAILSNYLLMKIATHHFNYKSLLHQCRGFAMLVITLLLAAGAAAQKVSVTATAGTASTGYATLKAAFIAINAGTHRGVITIRINATTSEGVAPATLNSSGAGSASYTSVSIAPSADNVTISGTPGEGFGVIQLNGADNVTIDGDNPNTAGINRNLTIINTSNSTTAEYTSVVRVATSSAVTTADNITIKNCIITGNATGKNAGAFTSTTTNENASWGIYVGGNAGNTVTAAPLPLNSVTANTSAAGQTYNTLLISNNAVNACARGIVVNGAAASNSSAVTISNNLIGDQVVALSGTPPYTTPVTTVYVKGIAVSGTTALTISGNTVKNIVSYVPAAITGIELNAAIGSGTIAIGTNTVNGVIQNNSTDTNKITGIAVYNAGLSFTVSGNTVNNIQGRGGSLNAQTSGLFFSTAATSATVESNKVTAVYNRNSNTWGVQGINLAAGNNITLRNNFVADINQDYTAGSTLSSTFGAIGIKITGGTGHKIYHNSVNMYGALMGTAGANNLSAAFAINSVSRKNMEVLNNIFTNVMTGGTTPVSHVAVSLPSSGTSAMNLLWNNNAYFSGSTAAQGIAQVGSTAGVGFYTAAGFNPAASSPATNLRAYTSTLGAGGTNDNASFASTAGAPFNTNTDLHINAAAPVSVNLDGKGVSTTVTTDIDAQSRTSPPDIGADEFSITASLDMGVDALISPSVSSCHSSAENVVVSIHNFSATLIDFAVNPITVTAIVSGQATATLPVVINSGTLAPNTSQQVIVGQLNTSVPGTYNFTCSVALDTGTDVVPANNSATVSVVNTALTAVASASPSAICAGNASLLNVVQSGGNGSYTYLWSGGTAPSNAVNSTGAISATNNYTVTVTDGCLASVIANTTVTVNNPQVTSVAGASHCGAASLSLAAQSNAGATLKWYAGSTGGSVLATGPAFATPVINNTTTYYVAAISNVNTINAGRVSPATTLSTLLTDAGLTFDVTQRFTLNSVDVFPNSTGTTLFSVALVDNAGATLFTSSQQKAPAANGTTAFTVSLGWSIPEGIGYRLVLTGDAAGSLVREASGFSPAYPYVLGTSGNITGGWFSGASSGYYFFYNWSISEGCESSRTPVTATINAAPSISTSGSTTAICSGASATLTAGSANASYTYTWMPGSLGGASVSVSPASTTVYTVNASDNSNGPNGGCTASADVTVTVSPLPAAVNISPASVSVCSGSPASQLTATTGTQPNPVILTENFNNGATSWVISNGAGTPNASKWHYEATPYNDDEGSATFLNFSTSNGGKFSFANADAGGQGTTTDTKLTSPAFSTVGFLNASLSFENNYRSWSGDVTVALEISTDGGTNWSVLKDYKALGNQGNVTDDAQTTVTENINLASYLGQANLKIRFNYKSEWGYYWIVDNLSISGTTNSGVITWSPFAGLYTDANATTPYTGAVANTVFAKPSNTATYTALSTNAVACSSSNTVTVSINPAATANAGNNQAVCYNGIVNLNGAIGGTATTGTWTSSGTGTFGNANNLTTTYTPSASDKTNGSVILTLTTDDPPGLCTAASSSIAVTIAPSLVLNVVPGTILCRGGSTTITITATGGTPPYNGTGTFPAEAGFFTHTVTDAMGCSRTVNGTIPQPSALTASAVKGPAITCFGGTTTVTVSASGGTPPYTGTGVFTVPAGSQSFTVTDNNGCTKTVTVNITQPTQLVPSANVGTILCNGGTTTITVTATGGTAPYTGTGTFTVGAGPYSYTVTDSKGCSATVSGTVTAPDVLSAGASPGTILCNGGTTTITVNATGGTLPYTGTGTFTVSAGPYTYTVTDANGCSSVVSGSISEPAVLNASANAGTILCNGGSTSITVNATGGTTPYSGTGTFTVGAGPYSYTVTDANGCTSVVSGSIAEPPAINVSADAGTILCNGGTTTITISASGGTAPYSGTGTFTTGAGPYSYTVTDINGCSSIISGTITQPAVLTANAAAGTIVCNGGTTSVSVTATGGTAPYTGTGIFTAAAGTYSYTVTDANGCTTTTSVTISQPGGMLISVTKTNVSCFNGANGTIKLSPFGGTAPYTYSFDGGNTYQAGDTKTGLTAGNYSVAIKDANNCVKIFNGVVAITQPSAITASYCYNAPAKILHIAPAGGVTPYKFSLDGVTYIPSNANDGGRDVIGVNPGTYTIYVKDKNNCVFTQTISTATLPPCTGALVNPTHTGINSKQKPASLQVTVTPNPSESFFTLYMQGSSSATVTIRVLDSYGKVLFTAHGDVGQVFSFGDDFVSGLYIVEVTQGTTKKILKVVKG